MAVTKKIKKSTVLNGSESKNILMQYLNYLPTFACGVDEENEKLSKI